MLYIPKFRAIGIKDPNLAKLFEEVEIEFKRIANSLPSSTISILPTHSHSRSDVTDLWSSPFWSNIPDKPSSFPPSAHEHNRSDISNFWSSPFWNNIPDKPSTYPPSSHDHTRTSITDFWNSPFWNNIPDKPSSYPPSSHTHPGSDITSQVSDSDKLDGYHASNFALSSHSHVAYPVYAYMPSDMVIAQGWNVLNITSRLFDPNNRWDTNNKRYVAPVNGYYHIDAKASWLNFGEPWIFINENATVRVNSSTSGECCVSCVLPVFQNDYISFRFWTDWQSGVYAIGGVHRTYICIYLIAPF